MAHESHKLQSAGRSVPVTLHLTAPVGPFEIAVCAMSWSRIGNSCARRAASSLLDCCDVLAAADEYEALTTPTVDGCRVARHGGHQTLGGSEALVRPLSALSCMIRWSNSMQNDTTANRCEPPAGHD